MGTQINIDPQTGSLSVGGVRLEPLQSKSEAEPQIARFVRGERDHGNGHEWLYLGGLTFGGQQASLGLCFHDGRLEQASWSVQLPNAPMEGGWPTREAIDEEVTFVRTVLAQEGLAVDRFPIKFRWGEMWSSFDEKAFIASNGLRYRAA